MTARVFVGLAMFAMLAGCGGRAIATPDARATDAEAGTADVGADGSGVFTVFATLTVNPVAGQSSAWNDFPKTQTFTMSVDTAGLRLVMGARGAGTAVALTSAGSRAFESDERIEVPVPFARFCNFAGVTYEKVAFSIEGGRLVGTGRGTARATMGPLSMAAPVTATFVGQPDDDLPTLIAADATIDPMAGATFAASEPLADSSAASLIGADGDVFALGAQIADGPPRFTTAFVRSTLMLGWASTYELTTEALIDLAGHAGSREHRPHVVTPPAPVLAAEDGFESVTASTFGGADVLTGGRLPPIAGTKSLVLGTQFPQSVAVRLAIQPGDMVVRFSMQLIDPSELGRTPRPREARVGVPGREVSVVPLPSVTTVEAKLPDGSGAYVSDVTTIEVPLPAGARGEASFEIADVGDPCWDGLQRPLLIVDDLRAE